MKKVASTLIFRAALTILVSATFVVSGCTSKDKGGAAGLKSGNPLAGDALLLKLPTSTAAFAVMDFAGDGYKLFSQSPYGGSKNAKKSIDALIEKIREAGTGEELVDVLKRVLDSSVQLGLVAADGSYTVEKVLARSVVFGGPATNGQLPIDAGIFLKGASGVSMTDKLEILKSSFSGSSLKIAEESIAGATKGFNIGKADAPAKIYFAASTELLGATLSKPSIEGLFAKTNTGAIEAIQTSPEYKQATSPFAAPEKPLAFTYASLLRLKPVLESIAKADESGEFKPGEMPFDALAIQSSFPKQYVHNLGMAVSPKTETQTKVFTALQEAALSPASSKLPNDAAFSVALDTRFVGKLETIIKSINESAPAGVTDQVKQLESVTIGMRNNTAGSPLPDIFLMLESAGREQLGNFIESSLGTAMSLAGQNTSWQKKEIEGTPTKFFTTLIGAGVYVGSPNNSKSLLIGSSENVLKDTIGAQSGKSAGALASLPAALKTQITSANIATVYCNFSKVADILDSVKNTLAMFTGGSSELNDVLQAANIRSWGLATGGISYTPGVLAINSSFDASQK